MREAQTDVLVVGAGPVGLWTALLLAESGLDVALIDRQARTAVRSYACALHPRTLQLMDRFGLAKPVIQAGRRVETIAFYDGHARRAEVHLSKLAAEFPFVVILPQNSLESLLEQRLREAGVNVQWNHRFEGLTEEEDAITATVEELAGTSTGYIVPHWETIVKNRSAVRAHFLVGTDGHHSLVRQRAGLDHQQVGETDSFAAFEFESRAGGSDEVRVVLDEATTNVLWPLAENRYRWTFQLVHSELPAESPEKERRAVRLAEPQVDERIRQYVARVARQRAPWFSSDVETVHWCSEVTFERRLVTQFGRNRCWLAGDAAHQTGPVGVQSMNMGFYEAKALAAVLRKIVLEGAALDVLLGYNSEQQKEWRGLLGLTGGLKPRDRASSWVRQCHARILPCLPACDGDLVSLADQLKLSLS